MIDKTWVLWYGLIYGTEYDELFYLPLLAWASYNWHEFY